MKALKIEKNKQGLRIALCSNSVLIEKINYKLGRDVKSWCYIAKNIDQIKAEEIFNKRVNNG